MNNGKLFWNQRYIIKVDPCVVCMDIPMELYVKYDPMDDTPWRIREAIYNHMRKIKWPVKALERLYFFYKEDVFQLRILIDKDSYNFYKEMYDQQQ